MLQRSDCRQLASPVAPAYWKAYPRLRPRRVRARAQAQDLDPIERAVKWLFGKKALEERKPLGLERLSGALLETQFEANVTDRAEPVADDSEEVARFRPMLAHTMLEYRALRIAFSAGQDGWSACAFHRHVDNQGPAVVIAESEGGAIFGGMNPCGWEGLGDQLDSRAAFLFTWPEGNTADKGIKLQKVGGPGLAVMDDPDTGPRFGAEGLLIPLDSSSLKVAYCRLGTFYQRMPDGSRSLFPDGNIAQLTGLKVYVAAEKL